MSQEILAQEIARSRDPNLWHKPKFLVRCGGNILARKLKEEPVEQGFSPVPPRLVLLMTLASSHY
jgi:hypothetical protein